MSVRIRMKKMGRAHRSFFRICAVDKHSPRDGRVIEELGTYDPKVPETDARALLKADRVAYWLGVGAQPSDKVAVLIKKYGPNGTHVGKQQAALEKLAAPKSVPAAGPAAPSARKKKEGEASPAPEATAEAPAEASAEEPAVGASEG